MLKVPLNLFCADVPFSNYSINQSVSQQ